MSVSSIMTLANVVLMAALVAYYIHAYQYNTIDFIQYRARLEAPTAKTFMKYVYVNSFVIFIACTLVFIIGICVSAAQLATATFAWCWVGLAVVLLIGAVRLLMMRSIARWPKRAR